MKYGLYGARMQDIADTAGINKALLHYYFRNKEKLFDQVFDGALSRYFEQLAVIHDTTLSLQERLMRYVENVVAFFSEYPQMTMFIIKEIGMNPVLFSERVSQLKKNNGLSLVQMLEEEMDKGTIARQDPVIFMMHLHSLCAYPFLARPIFNSIVSKYKPGWEDQGNAKLIASVQDFIRYKLTVNKTQE